MNNERPTSYRVQNACENCRLVHGSTQRGVTKLMCMHDASEVLSRRAGLAYRSEDEQWVAMTYFRTVAEHGICDYYEHK